MTKTVILSLACISIMAQESFVLHEQTVTATHLKQDELSYAAPVEIYTSQDIENSKSKNIYDFLNQETSVSVLPSYGNPFVQKIDMRGYGIGDGYQNIVVIVNGRRMNNIDGAPQLLSSVPIGSIEKMEILKGAGSVEYGDGANAGVISITTKDFNGVNLKTYGGNFGSAYASLGAGYADDTFALSAFGDYFETDGQRQREASGEKKDSAQAKNGSFDLKLYPTEALELRAGWAATRIDTNYAKSLSLDAYKADPTQAGSGYTNQTLDSDLWSFGLAYSLNTNWGLDSNIFIEEKKSVYTSSGWTSDYDYNSADISVKYSDDKLNLVLGTSVFNGKREGSSDTTSKENLAGFVKANYLNGNHSLSAGLRIEKVTYEYKPNLGNDLKQDDNLEAYELGYNYKLDKEQSIFASFAHAFQAPDIDRFFSYGTFNGFIQTMKSNTFNVGYNHFTKSNKLKAALFYADISDEIYFTGAPSWINTNLDETSKLGFEVYDKYLISDNLYLSVNYTYVEATIEKDDNQDIENKTLPGVSKHNLTASIGYAPTQENKLIASHTYRSSAYAANDFTNAFTQKQEAYHSTDVSAAYQYDKHIEIFAKIQNLFDEDNGIWIRDDAIYPVNFQRSFQIGLNGKF
jgi:iron complex outermembrane receptor protein